MGCEKETGFSSLRIRSNKVSSEHIDTPPASDRDDLLFYRLLQDSVLSTRS